MEWCTSIIPVPERLRLEGCRFKASLECIAVYGECKDTLIVRSVGPSLSAIRGECVLWERQGLLGLRSVGYVYRWVLQGEN